MIALDRGPDGNIAVQRNGSLTNFELSAAGGGTPANPFRTQTIFFNYQFLSDAAALPGRVFATTNMVRFDIGTGDIFGQYGDVFSFNTSNPGNLMFDDVLFNTNGSMAQPPLFASGSNFNMFGVVQPDASNSVGSTTATGGDTQTGNGILRIVDVSNPAALAETGTFVVPGTKHVQGIALEGDVALVLATDGGWRDPFTDVNDIGPTGNIVVVTLDVSDPDNPAVLDSLTVARSPRGLAGPFALGSGQFLFSSTGLLTDTPRIYVVDASDPLSLAVGVPLDLAAQPRRGAADAELLLPRRRRRPHHLRAGRCAHADHRLGAGAQRRQRRGGAGLVQHRSGQRGAGRGLRHHDLDAPERRDTELERRPAGHAARRVARRGTRRHHRLRVLGHAGIDRVARRRGRERADSRHRPRLAHGPARHRDDLRRLGTRNPGAGPVTYDLSVLALPPGWVDFPSSVLVGAGEEAELELSVSPDPYALAGDYELSVVAQSGTIVGSASALLEVAGASVLPTPMPEPAGVVVQVSPPQATGGQGTPARFSVRVINTGSGTDTFELGGGRSPPASRRSSPSPR